MKKMILLMVIGAVLTGSIHAATVSGIITDLTTGTTIGNAPVVIAKTNGLSLKMTQSDAFGYFEFKDLSAGDYLIKVNYENYEEYELAFTMAEEENKNLFVYLSVQPSLTDVLFNNKDIEEHKQDCSKTLYSRESSAAPCGGAGYNSFAYDEPAIDWNTESYDYINENKFKTVTNDPLSTFSIDVDRASYSNVRRFITQNQMPYADAVRVEELINYFDYTYKQPTGEHPFSTTLELGTCPWNKDHQLLLIGIQGKKMISEEIPANNLVFLIDVSGSMSDINKLPLLKQSFKILIDQLRPQDRVAIVVYAGAAGQVLASTSGKDKAKISAALDLLEAGGSTAGGAGINLAYKIAKENYIPNGNNRVILATDGDFNVGASSDGEMERLIEQKRNDGIFLTILGFGMGNYKDSKMEKLSNKGNGNYAYIDNIMEAKKIFSEELWGTLFTIAKDVKIQIEFNPSKVKAYRLIGYENRLLNKEDFNDDTKDAGEIGSGHSVTALYEIIPGESGEPLASVDPLTYQDVNIRKSNDLMTLKIRYKDPKGTESKLITSKVASTDLGKISDNFKLAASLAEFGMLLRNSEFKGTATYEDAIRLAKEAMGNDPYGYRAEYVILLEKTKLLSK
ncbi:MAG TPA: von Willebrand factor type A domain-containing protein [Bacteroidales bacterium]|nr:von Willebrand factor type A domain-containing protein [Bacteroidales bacterium]HQP05139.1 von Willebrand factor type A domain-containing protein [Bacteroidales bacterium]